MRTPQDSERCFVTLVWEVCNLNEWRLPGRSRPESLMILRYRWRHSGTLCASPAWCWVSCRSTCRRPSALQLSSSLRARWPMRTSRPYLSIAAWRTVSAEESTSVSRGLPFPGTSSAQGLGYRLDSPKFLMIGKRRHLAVRFA